MIPFFFGKTVPADKSRFIYFAFFAYVISLYLYDSPIITNGLMFLIFLLAFVLTPPWQYITLFKKNKLCLGISFFFIVQAISAAFSSDTAEATSVLTDRLPLFVLPLAFCLIRFDKAQWDRILLFYSFVTAFASFIGFAVGAYMAISRHDSGYLYNDNISELILDKQAVYFGFYVNMAVLIFIYAIRNSLLPGKLRYLPYLSLAWLVFISFMLASKISMACLLLILLAAILHYVFSGKNLLGGAILVLGLITGVILANKFFPKTFNRFRGVTDTHYIFDNKNRENHFNSEYNREKWNSTNTRSALWLCGWEIWKKNFLLGTGLGDKRAALREKYAEKNFMYALETRKNLHNQYLDIAVSMGAAGLLLFLFLYFFYPLRVLLVRKQFLSVAVFACAAISLFTENMFDRYQGEIILGFILPLAARTGEEGN